MTWVTGVIFRVIALFLISEVVKFEFFGNPDRTLVHSLFSEIPEVQRNKNSPPRRIIEA